VAFPLQQTDSSPSSHYLRRNLSSRLEETTATPRSTIGPSRLQELKVEDNNLPEAVEQAPSPTNNKNQSSSHSDSLKNSGSILRKPQYLVRSQEDMPPSNKESSAQPSKPCGETSPAAKDRSFALPFRKEVSNSAAAVQNNIASAIHQQKDTDPSTSKKQSPSSTGNLEKAMQKDSEPQSPVLQSNETPQEDKARELAQLQSKLDELDAENTKLKALYHGEQDRVYNLQNALASQKLASSHTVLDDSQYERMFKSLDDSINDVSYQIRKDWVSVPPWLKDYIHEDATTAGTKEMIAVGRALISRFVHDEIFQRYLHPGIYEPLSKHLKRIDLNLRSLHINPGTTEENREAGAAYISSWRAATMEGLSGLVQRDGQANKAKLAKDLTNDFLQRMMAFLKSPAPQILEGGVQSIVDLALDLVEFTSHESRDIQIQYFLPNQEIDLGFMTKDMSLPLLPPATDGESKKQSLKEATPSDEQRTNNKKKRSTLSAIRMKMHGTKELQLRPTTPVAPPPDYAQEDDPLANRMRFSAFFAVAVFTNGNMRDPGCCYLHIYMERVTVS
ncbi:hypothetical protein KEM56_007408, partial [Ascosphaera pollenicola]